MCDSSQTSCSVVDPLRSRSAAERSDEPQTARHRLGAHATEDHSGQRAQGPLRAALAATLAGTKSVLEARSSEELYLSWQDERRAAVGCNDSANLQDGGCTSSYQEAGHATYPSSQFRDWTTGSRRGSHGNQQAARALELYDYHDLFTLPQAALGLDAQSARLVACSAVSQVDRPVASVTIGTVADEETRQAAAGQERVAAPEDEAKSAPTLTVHSLLLRFTPSFIAKHRQTTACGLQATECCVPRAVHAHAQIAAPQRQAGHWGNGRRVSSARCVERLHRQLDSQRLVRLHRASTDQQVHS